MKFYQRTINGVLIVGSLLFYSCASNDDKVQYNKQPRVTKEESKEISGFDSMGSRGNASYSYHDEWMDELTGEMHIGKIRLDNDFGVVATNDSGNAQIKSLENRIPQKR